MKKLVLLILAVLCMCSDNAVGNTNEFRIGIAFDLSTGCELDVGSMRLWAKVQIDMSTPNGTNRFRAGEIHHLYVGAALFSVGKLADIKALRVVGGVLMIDDAIQHVFRVNSPIHMLNDELYQYGWYRSLVDAGSKIAGQDR